MKRLVLLLAVVVVAVVLAFLSLPEDPGRKPVQAEQSRQPAKSEAEAEREALKKQIEAERDKRLAAMKVEYKKLEKARRNLQQRLQEISYYLARTEVPEEQASSMREEIGAANRLLINPPLLGAFRGPDDIVQELEKIERVNRKLDEYETVIREHGGYNEQ